MVSVHTVSPIGARRRPFAEWPSPPTLVVVCIAAALFSLATPFLING